MTNWVKPGEKTSVPRMAPGGSQSKKTTHIYVADTQGNCVTLTHSLGSSSGTVTDGLGFMYSNCILLLYPRPGKTSSLALGKPRFTVLPPTIIFKDDKPFFLLGSPSGTTITVGNLQAILSAVDFDMGAQEAMMAPRYTTISNTIEVTNRILCSRERKLRARVHPTHRHAFSLTMPILQAMHIVDSKLGWLLPVWRRDGSSSIEKQLSGLHHFKSRTALH